MAPRCIRHRPLTVTPLDVDQLDAVLDVMAGIDTATVVFVEPDGDHAVFGIRELPSDPRCIGAGLFGLRAPAGAALAGLCFGGTSSAHPLRPATGDGRPPGPDHPLDADVHPRVDVAVTVDGRIEARVHPQDGSAPLAALRPEGIVVDALHRVLGRPAPGGPPPLDALVVGMWLTEVAALAVGDHPPTWADVAAAHDRLAGRAGVDPTVADRVDAARGATTSPAQVGAWMHDLVAESSWVALHQAAAIGRMAVPELTAAEAAWMDTTMFSRWMTDSFPSPPAVLDRLVRLGATEAAEGIESAFSSLGDTRWDPGCDFDVDAVQRRAAG